MFGVPYFLRMKKNKVIEMLLGDGKVAVAIDGSKASVALLETAFKTLGDNAVGIAVVSTKTPLAQLSLIKKLDGWLPLKTVKIDVSKVKNLDVNTDIGKEKYSAIVFEAILNAAGKDGFWTVYSGLTADRALFEPNIATLVDNLGLVVPYVELDITTDEINVDFPRINI
jgi:ATP-utilizing enzymes of the PP-loop superfamily